MSREDRIARSRRGMLRGDNPNAWTPHRGPSEEKALLQRQEQRRRKKILFVAKNDNVLENIQQERRQKRLKVTLPKIMENSNALDPTRRQPQDEESEKPEGQAAVERDR